MTVYRPVAALTIVLSCMSICDGSSSQNAVSTAAPIWTDTMMQRIGAKVMGESALIDRETGRIFWEGGSKTSVTASIAPMISDLGLHRLKSSLLSIALFSCLISMLASNLRILLRDISQPITWRTAVFMGIAKWTIFKSPDVDNWLIIAVVTLYFFEAYHCNTRRYLANAISSPGEVEEYIERLRNERPVVTWKVRCYHYERRTWANLLLPHPVLRKLFRQDDSDAHNSMSDMQAPSWLTKKVVKHVAEANYVYKSCMDNTIAGLWKRAPASVTPPPFTKIVLTKLLILGNDKARQDYFQQQANFVTMEGQSDEFAEFSTNISLKGFKPQLLAVRNVACVRSAGLFRLHMFWIFTMVGLTLPFRIWFSRHCDELRVTVAKETFGDPHAPNSKSWFGTSSSSMLNEPTAMPTNNDPDFRLAMQHLSLYGNPDSHANNATRIAPYLNGAMQPAKASHMPPSKGWFGWLPSTSRLDVKNELQLPSTIANATENQDNDNERLVLQLDIQAATEALQLLDSSQSNRKDNATIPDT